MKKEKQILKWLNNDLSSKEMEDLKQSEDLQTLEKIAHYASQLEVPKVDSQTALEKLQFKKKPKIRTLNFKTFYSVAAVLVLALTSGYFFFYNINTSIETQIAQRKTFTLPDNSEVVLNAESKITFNEKKWAKKRSLTLQGEAFFKVKKGQTFSVKTTDGIVTVLGTQFNVKARKNYFEVHCYEGLVSVTHNNKTTKLPPGKILRVINEKVENVEDFYSKNPSWILQESSFIKIPLDQVIAELERQYDLKIKVDGVDTSKLFTGSFTHTNKEIALQAVTIPLQLSYKIEGKTIIFYNYGAN